MLVLVSLVTVDPIMPVSVHVCFPESSSPFMLVLVSLVALGPAAAAGTGLKPFRRPI